MNPTIGIVALLLSKDYDLQVGFTPERDAPFEECAAFNGGKLKRGVLYVVDSPITDAGAWKGTLAVCLAPAREDAVALSGEFHVIARERNARSRAMSREARFLNLVNAVLQAVRCFDSWALELQHIGYGKPDYFEMLQLTEKRMGLVSMLVSKNLRYLAVSSGFEQVNPWFDSRDTSMGTDMINELISDEAFLGAIERRGAFFYIFENGKQRIDSACFNVTVANHYEARLLMQYEAGKRVFGQLTLTSYLGELFCDIFGRYAEGSEKDLAEPEFFRALLEVAQGGTVKEDYLKRVMAVRGWNAGDQLLVHAFSFIEPESESVTRRYYQDRIAHLFENCAALQVDGLLYCVRNLRLEQRSPESSLQELVLFLRENLCHAGTSHAFDDLGELRLHLAEARCALQLGEKGESMQWHYWFEDYAMDYICDQAQRELGAEALVHPAFIALRQHDEQHGTELLHTVRIFMECKYNVTRASERLCIHRSSMLARLDRINDVAGFDWDSWDNRLRMALSFKLADARIR